MNTKFTSSLLAVALVFGGASLCSAKNGNSGGSNRGSQMSSQSMNSQHHTTNQFSNTNSTRSLQTKQNTGFVGNNKQTHLNQSHISSPLTNGQSNKQVTQSLQSNKLSSHNSLKSQSFKDTSHGTTAQKFNNSKSFSNYHLTNGKQFSHGYCYPGNNHCQWTHYCWWPSCGCYCNWDPCTSCYYYWCESADCFYPVSYASVVAPTPCDDVCGCCDQAY